MTRATSPFIYFALISLVITPSFCWFFTSQSSLTNCFMYRWIRYCTQERDGSLNVECSLLYISCGSIIFLTRARSLIFVGLNLPITQRSQFCRLCGWAPQHETCLNTGFKMQTTLRRRRHSLGVENTNSLSRCIIHEEWISVRDSF